MSEIVIVAYRPRLGCDERLEALLRDHVPFLRRLGLATERVPVLMRAADGTFVEVFEWCAGAVAEAHGHPEIARLWEQYAEVCTYEKLTQLAEATTMFATFKPV